MKTPINQGVRAGCEARIDELLPVDINKLTEFAEHRLAAQGLNPNAGEDVTQRALMAILIGLESDQGGRKPRLVDTESKNAFLNFARGVISSVVEAMGRKSQFRTEHKPWRDEMCASCDETILTPEKNAELNDLKEQLFKQLRVRAPQRLQRTINAWETVFTESDRIPVKGHRRNARDLKVIAQKIISELGGIR